jgi:hypothetical protein
MALDGADVNSKTENEEIVFDYAKQKKNRFNV